MQRIAIVFDNTLRPETTGVYCLRALQKLVQAGRLTAATHILPADFTNADLSNFDAICYIDDGLDYVLPQLSIPSAWWAIDTHLSFERCLRRAQQVDATFAAQKNGTEHLRAAGIENAQWLPLACDPELHGADAVSHRYDLAFVGNFFPGHRIELLQLLQEQFPRSFIGQCDYRRMAGVYVASKIVFNCSLQDDINMRVFEGLCSGSLLLTNDLSDNGLGELFQADQHLVTYRSRGELLEKVLYYLQHDEERERIARAGCELVRERHTYLHRMQQMLERLETVSSRHRAPRSSTIHKSETASAKSGSYYEFERPDVLELVPPSARRVLDIGCGGGRLGASIKQRQPAHVTGIELNGAAIDAACQRLDEVIIGDVESNAIEFLQESFDCVICADVLEHLRHPEIVLRKIRNWLTPDGMLVTSLPNVRNHQVIRSLLAGNWTYESAGLLDEDHVRFFTRREIEKLLFRAGFEIQQQRMVGGEGYVEWVGQGSPRQIQIGPFQLQAGSTAEAAEFFAYQYLTTATPAPARTFSLTSIILVTHNQWRHTKACLDSIRLLTDAPYELIIIDNGSTDGTVGFLRTDPDVQLIENPNNRGFPAAVNQGLQAARGEQVLLLNNDTVVTTGWLKRLLTALHSDPSVGLVGPVTNHISGRQQVTVSYDDLAQLDGFAWDWGKQQHGQRQVIDRLVGFCLLVKREVIERIGLLDERFGIGNFEDDDYCRRAIAAGFHCVVARDAFVHHVGSATFRGSGVPLGKVLQQNARLYQEKWGEAEDGEVNHRDTEALGRDIERIESNGRTKCQCRPSRFEAGAASVEKPLCFRTSVVQNSFSPMDDVPRGSECRPHYLLECNDQGELLLKPNNVKLSACLIVRDNENTIRPCLESLRPWMDEIIVVDTGSVDRTPQICTELGAKVSHSPWQDSFSQARNVSLCRTNGEWIFWMDSDDTLPESCGRKLRELVLSQHPDNVLGYIVQVHCPGEQTHDVTAVDHVKLIRNRPDLRFEFHIHEQILPAIRRAGGDVAWTDLYVVHSGSDKTPAGRQRKLSRDFKLLELDLASQPDHPFVLFNLGMTHADAGEHPQAVHHLQRCLEVSQPEESHLRKAYALLVGSLSQLGQLKEAMQTCHQGLQLFDGDKELLFRQAMLQHQTGQLHQAVDTYQRLLGEATDRHFTSIDTGLTSYKARHNLALVYEDLEQYAAAMRTWNEILQSQSSYEPAKAGAARNAIHQLKSTQKSQSDAPPMGMTHDSGKFN